MTAITITPQDQDLVAAHAALVEQRKVEGLTAGVAAGLSRKIGALELAMELQGIEYTPYTVDAGPSLADVPTDQIKSMLKDQIAERESVEGAGKRARLTRSIRFTIATLRSRGVTESEVPDYVPPTVTAQRISNDDLLTRIVALQKLLARGDQVRPKIRKLAQSQLDALVNMAADRNVQVPDAPETAPAPSSGDALDKIGAQVTDTMDAPQKSSRRRKVAA